MATTPRRLAQGCRDAQDELGQILAAWRFLTGTLIGTTCGISRRGAILPALLTVSRRDGFGRRPGAYGIAQFEQKSAPSEATQAIINCATSAPYNPQPARNPPVSSTLGVGS